MITIREAILPDVPVITDFQLQLAYETEQVELDKQTVMEGLNALLNDRSKGIYFVAEVNGVVAGCHSVTYEWSEWRNGVVWWLQSVYVAKPFRKAGVFRAMYDNIRNVILLDNGIRGLRLYVERNNIRAQQVYKAMGMDGDHYAVFEWMK